MILTCRTPGWKQPGLRLVYKVGLAKERTWPASAHMASRSTLWLDCLPIVEGRERGERVEGGGEGDGRRGEAESCEWLRDASTAGRDQRVGPTIKRSLRTGLYAPN